MERVVKFRGKRVSNGEWLYGDLMHDNIGGCYIYPIECDNLYKENAVLPESVGQFKACTTIKVERFTREMLYAVS